MRSLGCEGLEVPLPCVSAAVKMRITLKILSPEDIVCNEVVALFIQARYCSNGIWFFFFFE